MASLPMTLTTAGGRVIDLAAPKPEDIAIGDIAHALSHICRFGGHTRTFFSVAQHCVNVADLLRYTGLRGQRAGLLHDAAEAYLGDVVTPLKRQPMIEPVYSVFEERFERAIFERFNVRDLLLEGDSLWTSVKYADTLALHWEHRDLFPSSAEWELPEDIGALPKLEPLAPQQAYDQFLTYFASFFPAHEVDAMLALDRPRA